MIEQATLPFKSKKVFTNSMRDLNNHLNMLRVTTDHNSKNTEEIHFPELTNSLSSKGEVVNNESDPAGKTEETPKFVLKLVDINKILNMPNDNKIESTEIYRSNILKEHQRDVRDNILNMKRNSKNVKFNQISSNIEKPQNSSKICEIDENFINIIEIKSDIQDDIIYCNEKPLKVE